MFQAGSNPLHWIEAEVGGRSPCEAKKRPTIEVRRYEKAPIDPIDSIKLFQNILYSIIWGWVKTYYYHIWKNQHPLTSYFRYHPGARVLTHNHFRTLDPPSSLQNGPSWISPELLLSMTDLETSLSVCKDHLEGVDVRLPKVHLLG